MAEIKEGWGWLINSTKWHYFVDGRSLCRRWQILFPIKLERGNKDSPDNCKACRKILNKRFEGGH